MARSRLARLGDAVLRRGRRPARRGRQPHRDPGEARRGAYRGEATGRVEIAWSPSADGDADPGEVVWAWVPYEEDATQGKDRPVLVLGRDGGDLLGLMLTSRDHAGPGSAVTDRDGTWLDLGSGGWDPQGRPSDVRVDRVLRLAPSAVRREGAALDRERFERVAAAVRETLGW